MFQRMFIAALACIPAWACAQQAKPFEVSRQKTATATIQAVSQTDRHLVILTTEGERLMLEAGADVTNFDQIHPGDRIRVTYHEGIIAEVKPKGTGVEGVPATAAKARTAPGEVPAKGVATSIAATVKVQSIDTSFDTVTFTRPDGIVRTLAVETPEGKAFIDTLKPGDEVQITYREASAVSIEPARG
jgi:hypothetical protein